MEDVSAVSELVLTLVLAESGEDSDAGVEEVDEDLSMDPVLAHRGRHRAPERVREERRCVRSWYDGKI